MKLNNQPLQQVEIRDINLQDPPTIVPTWAIFNPLLSLVFFIWGYVILLVSGTRRKRLQSNVQNKPLMEPMWILHYFSKTIHMQAFSSLGSLTHFYLQYIITPQLYNLKCNSLKIIWKPNKDKTKIKQR